MKGGGRGVARVLAVLLASVGLLGGCTPLFVPPVPAELPEIPPRLRIADARLERVEARPVLRFTVREVPRDGWLAVQWFPPAGFEVASASVWLDAGDAGRAVALAVPDDVGTLREGRWRVVVSWEGRYVRQLEWREPAGGPTDGG